MHPLMSEGKANELVGSHKDFKPQRHVKAKLVLGSLRDRDKMSA